MTSHIYTLFTDTIKGTENARILERHLKIIDQVLNEHISEGEIVESPRGDEFKAVFTDPSHALHAALAIRERVTELADGLSDRIGIDDDTFEGTSNVIKYQVQARAYRIMQLCSYDSTLCSETFLAALPKQERDAITTHGPTFVKLKDYIRPIGVYHIGNKPPITLGRWQTSGTGNEVDIEEDLDVLGTFAKFITALLLYIFRDRGAYKLALPILFLIDTASKILRWELLEYHNAVNIADIHMLLYHRASALQWTERAYQIAEKLDDRGLQARSLYQKGHCLEHDSPSPEAVKTLRLSYDEFEHLRLARMAAWAAVFMGRCLRGLAEQTKTDEQEDIKKEYLQEAENWILASCVISTSRVPKRLWFRELRRRQMGYILMQLSRVRGAQEQFADSWKYLQLAVGMDKRAVKNAPGDAAWEALSTKKMSQELIHYKDEQSIRDTAFRIVEMTTNYIFRRP